MVGERPAGNLSGHRGILHHKCRNRFQLTAAEHRALRSQFATSKTTPTGRGGRRYLPDAFTEHGAIMAATILRDAN
jgi:hypothetical protein